MEADTYFCTVCGAKNKSAHRFCFACGAPIFRGDEDLPVQQADEDAASLAVDRSARANRWEDVPEAARLEGQPLVENPPDDIRILEGLQRFPELQVKEKQASRSGFLWPLFIVFVISLVFTAYKLDQYSRWIYISQEDWIVFFAACAVTVISLIGVLILSRPAKRTSPPPPYPMAFAQESRQTTSRRVFFWLCVIILILALLFAAYKLYQYSTWIYVGMSDWMQVFATVIVIVIAMAGVLRLRAPRKLVDQRGGSGQAAPTGLQLNPAGSTPLVSNQRTGSAPNRLSGPSPAAAPPKKPDSSGWLGFTVIMIMLAVAIGMALYVLDQASGTGGTSSGSDPCAAAHKSLKWWGNCNCNNTNGDSVYCDVTRWGETECYTDSHGMRMCEGTESQGWIPKICTECKNK